MELLHGKNIFFKNIKNNSVNCSLSWEKINMYIHINILLVNLPVVSIELLKMYLKYINFDGICKQLDI